MTMTERQRACRHEHTASNAAFDVCLDCGATVPVRNRPKRKSGRERAREGAAAAHDSAARDFRAAIAAAIELAVVECEYLTTDQVWARIPKRFHDDDRYEGRALGAAMTQAARDGMIERTTETRESERPENHARPIRVWRSLHYRPTQGALQL